MKGLAATRSVLLPFAGGEAILGAGRSEILMGTLGCNIGSGRAAAETCA